MKWQMANRTGDFNFSFVRRRRSQVDMCAHRSFIGMTSLALHRYGTNTLLVPSSS